MRINPVGINPFSQVPHKQGQPIQFGEFYSGSTVHVEESAESAERTNQLIGAVQQLNTTLNTRLGELIQVLKPVNPPYKDV
jgi:hypothetical protein